MNVNLSSAQQKLADGLTETFTGKIIDIYQSTGDMFVRAEPDAIVKILKYLKQEQSFIFLSDVFGADRYTSEERFEVIYNLLSLKEHQRLFVKVWLDEENPVVDSVTPVWRSANWHEREVYDMFGVRFRNHPDPRRIFMPEDYRYYPLRKEFPLLGIPGSIELPGTTPEME